MTQCVAIRNQKGKEQCPHSALHRHVLCGRHAKCKNPILWTSLHQDKHTMVTKIQARVKGWLIQRRLKRSGSGVLSRKLLMNDDDLVTCVSKEREHPFDYFGFIENGKQWWFHFKTIWTWSLRSSTPTNPYTKVPLDKETRIRLREMWAYNRRTHYDLPLEPLGFTERLRGRWNLICQIFEDNGFGHIKPETFMNMTKADYIVMFQFMMDDLEVTLPATSLTKQISKRYCLGALSGSSISLNNHFILQSAYTLLLILTSARDVYIPTYVTLSALYRV